MAEAAATQATEARMEAPEAMEVPADVEVMVVNLAAYV
tara:strand:+ start:888 stop:1001 length:114 start_codon:yes stop_codon:yes gene_type:complete